MVLLPRPSLTPDESTHLLEALRRLPAARWSSPSDLKDMLAEYLRWWQLKWLGANKESKLIKKELRSRRDHDGSSLYDEFPGDALISLSKPLDDVWHAHITHTIEYERFCQRSFGHYVHHHPLVVPDMGATLRKLLYLSIDPSSPGAMPEPSASASRLWPGLTDMWGEREEYLEYGDPGADCG